MFGPFKYVWAVDFEFLHPNGEALPEPVCLVAWELCGGQKIRLWKDQVGKNPPYPTSADSLFVAYAATAELSCHIALNWPTPLCVLDLFTEFRMVTNITPVDPRYKDARLLDALTFYGLDGIDTGEKDYWRKLILGGGPWSLEEREGILRYCEHDVTALASLLRSMIRRSHIDLPRALLRGRSMTATTRMQIVGVPINMNRFSRLQEREELIKSDLIKVLGSRYEGVYVEGSFNHNGFARYLSRRGFSWPLLESGQLDTKDKTFKAMASIHPELEPLRQLRYTQDKLKLNELIVGKDGFNRCWLRPFASRTSRNQPSNAHFIFGPAVWLRDFLIQPKQGYGLAYIDWRAQEFGIAAALSHDPAMIEAYRSEDSYITFGKQARQLPPDATEKTHGTQREHFKTCVLGTQYGIGAQALAARINQPEIVGRELLRFHRQVYKVFWAWATNRVNRSLFYNQQATVFGWTHRFLEYPKVNSIRNFFMQANGAEMLRLACCLGTEAGIQVCAPIHDAVLLTAPIGRLQDDIARMQAFMEEASFVVLDGFRLKTDVHVFVYPDHYSDPKGRGKEMLSIISKLL